MIEPQTLIERARQVVGEFWLGAHSFSAGSVGAALLTDSGRIYTGICIDVASGIGFCAEHAAIAEMLKARETRIEMVVAVTEDRILPPCGRCREFMLLVNRENAETQVIIREDLIVSLKEILPYHWLDAFEEDSQQS